MIDLQIVDVARDSCLRQQMFLGFIEEVPRHATTLRRLYENGGANQINTACLVNGEIVGGNIGGHLTFDTSYWNFFFVHPDYRMQGAGRALMHDFESRVKDSGRRRVECDIEDLRILKLFMKKGYRLANHNITNPDDVRIPILMRTLTQLSVFKEL